MVKGLYSYVNKNINPFHSSWKLNKEKYKLIESSKQLNNDMLNIKNDNPIYIIIDGAGYFFHIAEKINWFNYDNIDFLNILRKVCFVLLFYFVIYIYIYFIFQYNNSFQIINSTN